MAKRKSVNNQQQLQSHDKAAAAAGSAGADREPPVAAAAAADEQPAIAAATATTDAAAAASDGPPPLPRFLADLQGQPIVINHYSWPDVKHTLDDSIRRILADDLNFTEDNTHTDRRLLLGYSACVFSASATAYSFLVPFNDSKPVIVAAVVAYCLLNAAMIAYAFLVERDCIFVGHLVEEEEEEDDDGEVVDGGDARKKKKNKSKEGRRTRVVATSAVARTKGEYSFSIAFDPPRNAAAAAGDANAQPPSTGKQKRGGGGGAHHSKQQQQQKQQKQQKQQPPSLTRSVGAWFDVEGEFAADVFYRDVMDVVEGKKKVE
ncbi:microsomal signal peptidase 25 kDa subunit-domain-containing protein [Zopfochytrium polystomum]|nr:microsomal signal peptidase 25 kDa subunit-domain-containing protein [Zopfochytrium polystomum]